MIVLVVGATGSVGRHVVAESIRQGHATRALTRDASRRVADGAELVVGDLTDAATLSDAVDGIDAVVFAHGSHGGAATAERVDYGAVRNVLHALRGRQVRISLMTAIGVTKRSAGHDWKRRGERLVRASGAPYTIVRPGWFDYNESDQLRVEFLQGDRRWAGDPSDGVVGRQQIAQVLVGALDSSAATGKTLELVVGTGGVVDDLEPLFAALEPDTGATADGALDCDNMPVADEPTEVADELTARRDRGDHSS